MTFMIGTYFGVGLLVKQHVVYRDHGLNKTFKSGYFFWAGLLVLRVIETYFFRFFAIY